MADAERVRPGTDDIAADMRLLREAAHEAGRIALGYFRTGVERHRKADSSPVTAADLAVDRFLKETLTAARPRYGWLSEESLDDRTRLGRARTFVVDPIDGTAGFLAGRHDWTVSLAVVEHRRPVAAVLLEPVTGALWIAGRGAGACRDGAPIAVASPARRMGWRVAGPARLLKGPEARARGIERVPFIASLALRLARVAEGSLDAVIAKKGACDWDLAAADLIVHEAGGRLTDRNGEPVLYNGPEVRQVPVAAAGTALLADLLAFAAEAEREAEAPPA